MKKKVFFLNLDGTLVAEFKDREVGIMKLTIKIVAIVALFALAFPVIIFNGCGVLIGGPSGGCPDSVAPSGSSISTPSLGTPSTGGGCFPTAAFTVLDSTGAPMNGICVQIFTNGAIALHPSGTNPTCAEVWADPKSAITTRTDDHGNVAVEFVTPSCATTGPGTFSFFVEVVSGSVTGVASTTLTCP